MKTLVIRSGSTGASAAGCDRASGGDRVSGSGSGVTEVGKLKSGSEEPMASASSDSDWVGDMLKKCEGKRTVRRRGESRRERRGERGERGEATSAEKREEGNAHVCGGGVHANTS